MPHFGINQRSFPLPKVFALRRNGVRIAPFYCALYTVLLCGLRRIMQHPHSNCQTDDKNYL